LSELANLFGCFWVVDAVNDWDELGLRVEQDFIDDVVA
jgi:hypothetical protein